MAARAGDDERHYSKNIHRKDVGQDDRSHIAHCIELIDSEHAVYPSVLTL